MANQVVAIGDFDTPLQKATVTSDGALKVTSVSGSTVDTELPAAALIADGASSPTTPTVGNTNLIYNGNSWDRERANTNVTVLASAARTATTNSSDQTTYNARGAHIVIDVTAADALASVTFAVQGKDSLSGKYYTLLTSAAITAAGTTRLTVYPGATVVANVAVSEILPRTWRVTATHATGDSITYSVGASLVV